MTTGEAIRNEDDAPTAGAPPPDADGARADRLRAITAVPWLRECAPATLAILLRRSRLRSLAPGAAVTRRGALDGHLTVIVSGRVELTRTTAAGRRFVVSYLGPGQVIGVAPALDRGGAIHDSIAREPVRVLTVHGDDLRIAIDADRGLRWRVIDLLVRRSRQLHETLSDASVMPLPVRLARMLLSLRPPREDGALRLSQEALACMLGVPRQRVNRVLKSLERDGVLRVAYRCIVVVDAAALKARAEEPPG